MIRSMLVAGLVAFAAVAQGGASKMSQVRGEAALKAAQQAAPNPPEDWKQLMDAMTFITQHKFELFDENKDGSLTSDEWLEMHFAAFAVYNKRKDGRIALDEFAQMVNGPAKKPLMIPPPKSMRKIETMFNRLDRGHKGYLTIEDFREEAMKSFRENDVNRDGHVTQRELDGVATRSRRRQ